MKYMHHILNVFTLACIGIPYINYINNPQWTYMEFTVEHLWFWVGAIVFLGLSLYTQKQILENDR